MRSVEAVISREDLAQEYELERLEAANAGRPVRPRAWVEADALRRVLRQKREGKVHPESVRVSAGVIDELAVAPEPMAERRRSLADRAIAAASDVPARQREIILLALRVLSNQRSVDRVREWLLTHPGVSATHAEIAADCALRRETVTRAMQELGVRCKGPRSKGTL